MKKCSICKEEKPCDKFGKLSSSADGFNHGCKKCKRAANQKWRKSNPEKTKSINIRYKERNREKLKAEAKRYWLKNKDESNANRRKNRVKNRDEVNAKKRKDRIKNKDRVNAKARKNWSENNNGVRDKAKKYRIDNKDKRKAQLKEWHRNNPEKIALYKSKRRAMKEGLIENYTIKSRGITLKAFNNQCFLCKSVDNLCVDHHRPLSKGNSLTLSNAVVLCKPCNSRKNDKDPEEFYGLIECAELDNFLFAISSYYILQNKTSSC